MENRHKPQGRSVIRVRIIHTVNVVQPQHQRHGRTGSPRHHRHDRRRDHQEETKPTYKTPPYEQSLLLDPVGVSVRLQELRRYGMDKAVCASVNARVSPGLIQVNGIRQRQKTTATERLVKIKKDILGRTSSVANAVRNASSDLLHCLTSINMRPKICNCPKQIFTWCRCGHDVASEDNELEGREEQDIEEKEQEYKPPFRSCQTKINFTKGPKWYPMFIAECSCICPRSGE